MLKKLHLGHVAKSFALKEQPSLVGQSFQKQTKKRKRDEKQRGLSRKRKFARKTWVLSIKQQQWESVVEGDAAADESYAGKLSIAFTLSG
jgi:hypothetical protein